MCFRFFGIQVECYKVDSTTLPSRLQRIKEKGNVKIRIISFDEETMERVNHNEIVETKTNEKLIVEVRGFGEIKMEVQIVYEKNLSLSSQKEF